MNRLPLFILFEGIDGAGKSTQINALASFLDERQIPHKVLAEPTDGPTGREIRGLLRSGSSPDPRRLMDLFIMDREEDVRARVLPALAKGHTVLMDRYYFSNAAYQGAMGLDWRMILDENRSRNFPVPHRVYLLDLEPSMAMKRIRGRAGSERELFEKASFLERVRSLYSTMKDSTFLLLDASANPADVAQRIREDFLQQAGIAKPPTEVI